MALPLILNKISMAEDSQSTTQTQFLHAAAVIHLRLQIMKVSRQSSATADRSLTFSSVIETLNHLLETYLTRRWFFVFSQDKKAHKICHVFKPIK
jgi:hypothetical protein